MKHDKSAETFCPLLYFLLLKLSLCLVLQQHVRQGSLKDLRSLEECVQFINHWKEQVDQVCKVEPQRHQRVLLLCLFRGKYPECF